MCIDITGRRRIWLDDPLSAPGAKHTRGRLERAAIRIRDLQVQAVVRVLRSQCCCLLGCRHVVGRAKDGSKIANSLWDIAKCTERAERRRYRRPIVHAICLRLRGHGRTIIVVQER